MAFVRFSSLTNVSESGNGTTGWIYTRTGTGDYTTSYAGGSDKTLTGDFEVIFVYATGVPNGGLDDNNTADHSGNWDIGCYAPTAGANYEFVIAGAFGTPADATVADTTGDWVRYRRSGSTLTVAVSTNAGSSWTTIRTDTGYGTPDKYPGLNFNGAASIGPIYFSETVTFASAAATESAAVQNPAVLSTQPVSMGGAVAASAAVQSPAVTFPVTMGGPVSALETVQQPGLLSTQPVAMGTAVGMLANVQQPQVQTHITPSTVATSAAVQQPVVLSIQPVTVPALLLTMAVPEPAVLIMQVNMSGPIPISATVQLPTVEDSTTQPNRWRRRSGRRSIP